MSCRLHIIILRMVLRILRGVSIGVSQCVRPFFFLPFKMCLMQQTACANGEVAPFMGHNAFLRWRAIQDAAFVDNNAADGKMKIWSENNVSEDFDMALRLILKGYIVRYVFATQFGS